MTLSISVRFKSIPFTSISDLDILTHSTYLTHVLQPYTVFTVFFSHTDNVLVAAAGWVLPSVINPETKTDIVLFNNTANVKAPDD